MLKRRQVLEFFANRAPSLIGMEACAGAHYWARELGKQGHEVRLISPQFVKPYVKGNKNDANDAEAICEAVGRPNMRFVPVKTPEQQDVLALHRVRSGLVKERTAQANRLRGLLGEYGIIGKGLAHLRKRLPEILEDAENDLSDLVRALFADLHGRILTLDQHVAAYGDKLKTLNQIERGVPKDRPGAGGGADHGDGDGGLARRWSGLRDGAAGLGLARSGARPGFERRQAEAFGDQQTRRHLSAHPANPWSTRGGESRCQEA